MAHTSFEAVNSSDGCLSREQLYLVHPHTLEFTLQRYVLPILIVFGLLGNALNLLVLLSNEMKHKANFLLAFMAFADMAFLLCLSPVSLAAICNLSSNHKLYGLLSLSKNHFVALANWMSAASIWLVLTVTIERLTVIRAPISAKLFWSHQRLVLFVSLIITVSALLTAHHHFAYDCLPFNFCNGTQLIYRCFSVTERPNPEIVQLYIRLSTIINAVLVVTMPILILIMLNFLLLHSLKEHRRDLNRLSAAERHRNDSERRMPHFRATQRNSERRVTITVATIACCFAVANGPSAAVFLWHLYFDFGAMGSQFYTAASVANLLVVIGKATNFFLFCSSSRHFRDRLMLYLGRRINYFTYSEAQYVALAATRRIMLTTVEVERSQRIVRRYSTAGASDQTQTCVQYRQRAHTVAVHKHNSDSTLL